MTSVLTQLDPATVEARLKAGKAVLIDIREPAEFARSHIAGALSRPLSRFESAHLRISADKDVIFTCGSGMRTGAACDRLAAAVEGDAFVLKGGLQSWTQAGLPVEIDRAKPIEIIRQVQITAGSLVIIGALLGWLVHPGFYALSAVVGAGLTWSGLSGSCMMASLLSLAPWNRTATGAA